MSSQESKRVLSGVLAILLGGFGVHKFMLGYTKEGVIQLLLGFLCGVGWLMGLAEGIIYLMKSDADFIKIYQDGQKPWF